MTTRQRLVQQKGQVDTQWEMIGSPSPLPSSEVTAEFDTVDAQGNATVQASYGGASNQSFESSKASGAPNGLLYGQDDQLQTQESYTVGPRMDSAVPIAYTSSFAVASLTAAVNTVVTTLPVSNSANFPVSGNYNILVDQEQMTVTAGQGTNSWTVTRHVSGTTAAAHASGATVRLV